MNYLSLLTDEETRYICSVIPKKHIITYFQQNPKEFTKIFPGFRASTIGRRNVGELLFKNRNKEFISSFIEMNIRRWIDQVKVHIDDCMEDGDNKELAYLHTLPHSFFIGNVSTYFKLIEEKYPVSYVSLLDSAVNEIKEMIEKQEKMDEDLQTKESELESIQIELGSTVSALKRSEKKLIEQSAELKTLKCTFVNVEKLEMDIRDKEEKIVTYIDKIQKLEKAMQEFTAELSITKESYQKLEAQTMAEIDNQQVDEIIKYEIAQKPLCPEEFDDFKDYLGYNLESIGVSAGSEYYSLLKDHLGCILFQGIPIIINRYTGKLLMKCVANSLIGVAIVKTLVYNNDISSQTIDDFLSQSGRIVCLDNFIGNYNETELLPLFEKHRDTVIFLTIAYDRTLYFVPNEFLKYCYYLNLTRIVALSTDVELTEDPSIFEEIEAVMQSVNPDLRYSTLLRQMLSEFGVCQSLIECKCNYISNEQDLCRMLAFDVLPYCVDVLQIPPYNTSERLVKYAGDSGRCSYKNLFKRWFA